MCYAHMVRKALESRSQIFHVLACGCTPRFCFSWKSGSGTSVVGNGAEYQTIVIDLYLSPLTVYHSMFGILWYTVILWYIWAMEVMNVWTMEIHSWNYVFFFLVPRLVYNEVCQSSINLLLKIRRGNSLPHGEHHVAPQFTITTPTVSFIYE